MKITSVNNDLVKETTKLLRGKYREESKLFLIEGEKGVQEALHREGGREDCDNTYRRYSLLLLRGQEHLFGKQEWHTPTTRLLVGHHSGDAKPTHLLPHITQLHRVDKCHRKHLEAPRHTPQATTAPTHRRRGDSEPQPHLRLYGVARQQLTYLLDKKSELLA